MDVSDPSVVPEQLLDVVLPTVQAQVSDVDSRHGVNCCQLVASDSLSVAGQVTLHKMATQAHTNVLTSLSLAQPNLTALCKTTLRRCAAPQTEELRLAAGMEGITFILKVATRFSQLILVTTLRCTELYI